MRAGSRSTIRSPNDACQVLARAVGCRDAERVDVNGEYVLRLEPVAVGVRITVANARGPEFLARANALIEAEARARGGLLAIEPIIDNVRYLVAEASVDGVVDALRAVRFGDRDYAALTEDGARRAVLARIAGLGGSVAWMEACPAEFVAQEFPLGYQVRDAIAALIERGALVADRARGQAPGLRLAARGAPGDDLRTLLLDWRRWYGDAPPVAYVLRERFRSRWFRVHSLPGGQRYATTDAERAEVLRRQNELASAVLGGGAACWFIFGYYGEAERLPGDVAAALEAMAPAFLQEVRPDDTGMGEVYPLLAASLTWEAGALDRVLEAVADELLETPLLVSAEFGRVVAPYDGGVDVIVEDPVRRSELARRFGRWS